MREFPPFPVGKACLLPRGVWLWAQSAGEAPPPTEEGAPPALSPREEAFWQSLGHPRRRLEWKQGRLMAKRLLAKALGLPPASFELLPQPEGPPLVLCQEKPLKEGCLSVSHTASYVGVAFAPFAVGLDICDMADAARISRIAHRAFSLQEAALCPEPSFLCALWALKEAALKMQGGGLFRPGLLSVQVECLFPPAFASPQAKASLHALPKAYVALAVCG